MAAPFGGELEARRRSLSGAGGDKACACGNKKDLASNSHLKEISGGWGVVGASRPAPVFSAGRRATTRRTRVAMRAADQPPHVTRRYARRAGGLASPAVGPRNHA